MLGFTKQEQIVVLFLLISLLIGASGRVYRGVFSVKQTPVFDSTYTAAFLNHVDELHKTENEAVDSAVVVSLSDTSDELSLTETDAIQINLNTATTAELQTIPHIGPVLAGKIIDFREQSGGFTDFNELISVNGIGKTTLNRILPYLILE